MVYMVSWGSFSWEGVIEAASLIIVGGLCQCLEKIMEITCNG